AGSDHRRLLTADGLLVLVPRKLLGLEVVLRGRPDLTLERDGVRREVREAAVFIARAVEVNDRLHRFPPLAELFLAATPLEERADLRLGRGDGVEFLVQLLDSEPLRLVLVPGGRLIEIRIGFRRQQNWQAHFLSLASS